MVYINIKNDFGIETISSGTYKEMSDEIVEQHLVYKDYNYSPYISSRATKEWRREVKEATKSRGQNKKSDQDKKTGERF
ncbi:hypothetical protein JHD46_05415 [Sulfurimonas sp. SAG-AH-194-C20]|nr:hypothetical protein [Sulfurimonas sp. SAG-AH-194-C20]MDF1879078.1 hypothetical protein [Sulfurimonas sp. SAG-AH-194-C20]